MPRRPVVLTFGLLTGMFAAGYGVMFTVLDDLRDAYGISEAALGLVVAMGFFTSFFAQLFIAPLADRGHARSLVFIGLVLNVVGLVTMAFGSDIWVLLAGRFVFGIGVGMAVPAVRRIVILAEPERLGHNLGRLVSADVAGFALGPALSAVLVGPFGIAAPFLVIAALSVACLPVILRVHVTETRDAPKTKLAVDLLRIRPVVAAVAMGSATFMMIGTFDALWVLVLDDLDAPSWMANIGVTIFATPFVLLASVGGRAAQRHGPFRIAAAGLLCGSLSMFLYGQMTTGTAMLVVGIFHATTDGLTVSAAGVAVGLSVPAERQAGAQGLLGASETLVGGMAALAAGSIYDGWGQTAAYTTAGLVMFGLTAFGWWWAGATRGLRGETVVAEPVPAA
ncbi:MAG TPA: MFS transporter [Ilumatobacteraceae bacterium]|nr:MFS transporter [Ilumatobacteraceae bacterium]